MTTQATPQNHPLDIKAKGGGGVLLRSKWRSQWDRDSGQVLHSLTKSRTVYHVPSGLQALRIADQ